MLTAILILLIISISCKAFAPVQKTATTLEDSLLSFNPTADGFSEERNNDAILLLNEAVDCSLTESCPVEDAAKYLSAIEEAQSMCLVDTPAQGDFCSNQDIISEVVARLNLKLASSAATSCNDKKLLRESILEVTGTLLMAVLMALATSVAMNSESSGTAGFTAQEWWWAVRDGYFPLMVIEFIKNGGLSV